jgi:hypothetical protein
MDESEKAVRKKSRVVLCSLGFIVDAEAFYPDGEGRDPDQHQCEGFQVIAVYIKISADIDKAKDEGQRNESD